MKSKRVFVDRIEGDVAVLLSEDADADGWKVPRETLPSEAKEGDWLLCKTGRRKRTTYEVDQEHTESVKQRVQSLMDELTQSQTQVD